MISKKLMQLQIGASLIALACAGQSFAAPAQSVSVSEAASLFAKVPLPQEMRKLLGSRRPLQSVSVGGVTPGPTPFIANVSENFSGNPLTYAYSIVYSKSGSYVRPVVSGYSANYLSSQGRLSATNVSVPVFGLYAGSQNRVAIVLFFQGGSAAVSFLPVTTTAYTDPCGALNTPTVQNNRKAYSDLSFDYFLMKDSCSSNSPAIIDTDGNLRWVGTTNVGTQSAILYNNGVYSSDNSSGVNRTDLATGVVTKFADYRASDGVISTGHHNFDPGRNGIVIDVNTTAQLESVNLEIDGTTGKVINRWDLFDIISAAMRAGGDDPTQFASTDPNRDWFHNNATTYNPADNTLIVSSRENFVIAVDYDTPADGVKKIHWILGDPTKNWHRFPSLQRFALQLAPGTLPPIGQHAVSIDHKGNLLLFDDGQSSFNQSPAGETRNYSAARSYKIDTTAMTATGDFLYSPQPSIYSDICSSIYEAGSNNYLVDFSTANNRSLNELRGLGSNNAVIFDIQYPQFNGCGSGWNSIPIQLSKRFN